MWILQEIFSYSRVKIHLGCNSISLWYVDIFYRIIDRGWNYNKMLQAHFVTSSSSPTQLSLSELSPKPLRTIRIISMGLTGRCLLNMLNRTMAAISIRLAPMFQSTKPEDRVFALLGLTSDTAYLGLIADYSKEIREIYTETASAILRGSGNLHVLSFSQTPKLVKGLPSWAPDWSMCLPANPSVRSSRGSGACLEKTSQVPRVGGDNLTLTGSLVDTVRSTLRHFFLRDGSLSELQRCEK